MELLLLNPKRGQTGKTSDSLLVQGASFADRGKFSLSPTITGTALPVTTITEEKFPGIGSIDFTTGRVGYNLPPLLLQDLFIECWVKLKTGYNQTAMHLIGAGNSVDVGTWNIAVTSSKLTFALAMTSTRFILTGGANLVAGQWYHLAVSRKGNSFYLFLNGTLIASGSSAQSLNGTTQLSIGDRFAGDAYGQYPTSGYIGAVRIKAGSETNPPTASFSIPTEPFSV